MTGLLQVVEVDRVWPPTVIGKRKASFTDPYVHDSDAEAGVTLRRMMIPGIPHELWEAALMERITVQFLKCDLCPVFVFPPTVEGFIRAMYINSYRQVNWFPKLHANWTFKYATVEDMAAIDPHRKLTDWSSIRTSKEINNSDVPKEEYQAKLRNLDDAEKDAEEVESKDFQSELKSVLFQEKVKNGILCILDTTTFRGSLMMKTFAFDGVRVANASFERLSSLGVLVGEDYQHATDAFTSGLIQQGNELELETLQTTADEIRRATATRRQLTQLDLDHLKRTQILVKEYNEEMIQHLGEWATRSQTLMEEAMMYRVKAVTSLQQIEKKASVLQTFVSSGATEIVKKAYNDAMKEKDQELIEKTKPSQECCICYHGLEGFTVTTSEGGEKRQKRACFLPCMHANVCTTCSDKRWNEGPKECPICRQPLTERPRVIYL